MTRGSIHEASAAKLEFFSEQIPIGIRESLNPPQTNRARLVWGGVYWGLMKDKVIFDIVFKAITGYVPFGELYCHGKA